jgi:hypothetical protein
VKRPPSKSPWNHWLLQTHSPCRISKRQRLAAPASSLTPPVGRSPQGQVLSLPLHLATFSLPPPSSYCKASQVLKRPTRIALRQRMSLLLKLFSISGTTPSACRAGQVEAVLWIMLASPGVVSEARICLGGSATPRRRRVRQVLAPTPAWPWFLMGLTGVIGRTL